MEVFNNTQAAVFHPYSHRNKDVTYNGWVLIGGLIFGIFGTTIGAACGAIFGTLLAPWTGGVGMVVGIAAGSIAGATIFAVLGVKLGSLIDKRLAQADNTIPFEDDD